MSNSFAALVIGALTLALGCHHAAAPPIVPGEPIAADAPEQLGTMAIECDALMAALASYRACPNLDDDGREGVDYWIENAKLDFAAGAKSDAPAGEQHEIAAGCHRATSSVRDAHARCNVGPAPKPEP